MKSKFYSYLIPLFALLGLLLGIIVHFSAKGPNENLDNLIWRITLFIGILPLLYRMAKDFLKGHFGIDIIAIAAIVSSFVMSQNLAGVVILFMLSGGEALEDYALNRSTRELTKLLSLAPTMGHIKTDKGLIDVKAEEIKIGDVVVVKPGEMVPVDGAVQTGVSEVDESSITGESLLIQKTPGHTVFSGSQNKDSALEILAQKPAAESQYQRIVKLVKDSQESRAPIVRLADRYAVWFTAITFILAIGAWLIFGDAMRFLAVLVVATPCPLILATPIAIISGISKCAGQGIIIKNGGALETLGEARALVFDKTGTLTLGEPMVKEIKSFTPAKSEKEILKLAASLDQLSVHALARALVKFSKAGENKDLFMPKNFTESFGHGVKGEIDGKTYLFGKLRFLKDSGVKIGADVLQGHETFQRQGKILVYLAQYSPPSPGDGEGAGERSQLLGSVSFADIVRPEMKKVFRAIKKHKIKKVYMLTGDKQDVAQKIANELGLAHFKAEMLPEGKVDEVNNIKKHFHPVAMIGDGVNDAPAMSAADVGVALAAHGSSASSETADIVIMQNNLMRVHDAVHIAQSVIRIAKQSIFAGLGLSIILMIMAALGMVPPVFGAVLQEVIDVAVILNALRVNFERIV